uniref:Uncharacterized protein n=1 Tax=Cacopsylla melanoneura TaxID=428564 RepID=A0A8D9DSU3_9HEMI
MEDPKYARRSKDIYSTPHPCCEFQSWPYDSRSRPAGRMERDEGQKLEQECCAAQGGRPIVNTPQREEYVVAPDCTKSSLCHTAGRRPRDIVPMNPREYDGKIQC